MFATSAAVLALAAAVAYAQDLSIQTPSLAQASTIPISALPVSSPPVRILGLDLLPPTVRELCNQLLWRHWSLLCR